MLAFASTNVAGTKPSNQRMAEKIGSQLPESRLYLGILSVRSPQWVILTILSLTDSNQSTQESSPNYFLTGIQIRCELSTSRIMTSRSDVVVRRIISTRPGRRQQWRYLRNGEGCPLQRPRSGFEIRLQKSGGTVIDVDFTTIVGSNTIMGVEPGDIGCQGHESPGHDNNSSEQDDIHGRRI